MPNNIFSNKNTYDIYIYIYIYIQKIIELIINNYTVCKAADFRYRHRLNKNRKVR